MTTESQRYNCFIWDGGNAIPQHACPDAKGSNPTTGLALLWARNPFREHFNHWQVSQDKAGRIFKRRHGNEKERIWKMCYLGNTPFNYCYGEMELQFSSQKVP
jgi:hypothetical protein